MILFLDIIKNKISICLFIYILFIFFKLYRKKNYIQIKNNYFLKKKFIFKKKKKTEYN